MYATRKRYKFYLLEGDPSPSDDRYIWGLGNRSLDVERMNQIVKFCLKEHDFYQFSAKGAMILREIQ
jgi:tRNA U38,U39,U40 pseudouridine synthase TruA